MIAGVRLEIFREQRLQGRERTGKYPIPSSMIDHREMSLAKKTRSPVIVRYLIYITLMMVTVLALFQWLGMYEGSDDV